MPHDKLNAEQVFHARCSGSPNAIDPEQVIRHHHKKRRGGMGGRAQSPPDIVHYFRFFNFSIRPDTRSCAASVACISRSIRIVRISPSRQPGGRSERGTFTRTDSSARDDQYRNGSLDPVDGHLHFRSPSDLWSIIVPLPSFKIAMSPLLPQTGSFLPMKSAVLFIVPAPGKDR